MAARVIAIAQQKGGAGKTTLAAQLAIAWAKEGARVALLDIDPQGSLAAWVDRRHARLAGGPLGFDFAALPGWRATQWVEAAMRAADLVLIDGPPHAETEARIAVRAAGLVLVPMQPSALDRWATEATLKMAAAERRAALVVLNRVPPRSGIADRLAGELAAAGQEVAQARVGNRVAFAHAMEAGEGVVESAGTSLAAAEIRALAEEVRRAAGA
jgi:chromosome partitioning protein